MIHEEQDLLLFDNSSNFLTEREFLVTLRDIGRRIADEWMAENRNAIGERSSLDYQALIRGELD